MTRKYRAPNDLNRTYGDFYPYMETDLTAKEYRSLMKDLFRCIVWEVIVNKRVWSLPFGLGRLIVRMRKKPADKQPIDYYRTKKEKRAVRFRNAATSGYIFVLLYQALNYENYRSIKTLHKHNIYNLHLADEAKLMLRDVIRDSIEDPFKKTYSVPYETPPDKHRLMR